MIFEQIETDANFCGDLPDSSSRCLLVPVDRHIPLPYMPPHKIHCIPHIFSLHLNTHLPLVHRVQYLVNSVTMKGKIAIEEAITMPELVYQVHGKLHISDITGCELYFTR
jgi:hypothetical protein